MLAFNSLASRAGVPSAQMDGSNAGGRLWYGSMDRPAVRRNAGGGSGGTRPPQIGIAPAP